MNDSFRLRGVSLLLCGPVAAAIMACAPAMADELLRAIEPPGQVVEARINPYEHVDWEAFEQLHSQSHVHVWWDRPEDTRERIMMLYDRGLRHLPMSNYYPSRPFYPLDEHIPDLPNDLIGGPNAEHHGMTGTPLHFNSLGSFYSTSARQGQGPVGVRKPWRESFDEALAELQFDDGGGITINHPVWSGLSIETVAIMFDHDERVLGIEVYNNTTETGTSRPGRGWSDEYWQELLSTGRYVIGFFTKDHPYGDPVGRNILLLAEATEHEAMRAYRKGVFYGALRGTTRIERLEVDVPDIRIVTDNGEVVRFISQDGVVHEAQGSSAIYELSGDEVFVRIEVDGPEDERVFSQPIMFAVPEP